MMGHPDGSAAELLSVALTSSGLENVLSGLTSRVNALESSNKAQQHRREALKKEAPDVDLSKKHLCETSAIQNLSVKNPEQQLATMAEAIIHMGQNINQFYKDVKYREAVQQATDTAQDELMQMELDGLKRELSVKFTRQDALDMRKMIASEMRSMREEVEQQFAGKLSTVYDEVSGQLSLVMDHVRAIQETTSTTHELLKYRIEEAFTDIQNASEDMDAKIRKITEMFGLSSDPTDNDTPSLPEMLKSISDLQQASYDCRDELDVQTEKTNRLTDKIQQIEESMEEQAGAMAQALEGEFGDRMSKMISDLEISMAQLEEKVEGEMAEQLSRCTGRLEGLAEQMQEKSASSAAVESVQDTLVEQARAHEELSESRREELRQSLEKAFEQKLSIFSEDMALLGARMEETAAAAEASSDKVSAVSSTTKTLGAQLEELQKKTAAELPALAQKVVSEVAAVRETAGGLTGELSKLLSVVNNNHSELKSHVKSSQAFIKMAADQHASSRKAAKALSHDVETYKTENGDRMTSLERSNVSVVTTMRHLQRSVNALATKEGRWDRLEVQTARHVQVLGEHLAEMEGSASYTEPFSLSPATQKHLSAVSQMVAKIMATRADYEVTRQAVNRKNPGEESDWDRKVDMLRLRYLNKFVSDVVQVATKLRPLPDRPVQEVRETFATKLELSMKLAISKYKPIQAGATILGKVHLLPSCMACDRPFIDNPGPGDPRSVVQDTRGERERSRERSAERSGGSPATAGANRSPGQWAKGGGGNGGGSPVPAYPSSPSFAVEDDGGSVTSMTSLASRDSQVSGSTKSTHRSRDRSPHKYVMRAGFKMRQSASEGGGLVARPRGGGGEENLHGLGGDARLAFGNGHSVSTNSAATSPTGRAGLEDAFEAEMGGRGGGRDSAGRRGADGGPRDHVNGSVLDLRPSTVSAQVALRREYGGAHVTFKDQERVRGWAAPGGGNDSRLRGGRGGVMGDEEDGFEESPSSQEEADPSNVLPAVHLPTLQ